MEKEMGKQKFEKVDMLVKRVGAIKSGDVVAPLQTMDF